VNEEYVVNHMDEDYVAKNLNEEIIDLYLDDCMAKSGMCQCNRCRADVRAFALNQLPAHYVVTKMGYVYTRLQSMNPQNQADVVTAIMKGIQLVKDRPRHD